MKLYEFIVPTSVDNGNPAGHNSNTKDLIYIDSYSNAQKNGLKADLITYPTDFAVACGAIISEKYMGNENRKSCKEVLRHDNIGSTRNNIRQVYCDGSVGDAIVNDLSYTIRPMLSLDIQKVLDAKRADDESFKINSVYPSHQGCDHIIKFGSLPNFYVGMKLNEKLENLYSWSHLPETNKHYYCYYNPAYNQYCELKYFDEYSYQGEKYVRVKALKNDSPSKFKNGDACLENKPYWFKVEPIRWIITNWTDLPTDLNPNGSGKATSIDVKSLRGIVAGIPYNISLTYKKYHNLWQNSSIRGFLNGINVDNITQNGNPDLATSDGGDFTDNNFIKQALSEEVKTKAFIQRGKRMAIQKQKGYGVSIDETPMTTDEQLNFYFQNGISFMLHGPSGVGKSDRVKQLDENLESITLRNGILPEEIIGKTRYADGVVGNPDWYDEIVKKINKGESTEEILKELDINIARNSGEWIAPNWYSKLVKKCAEEPNKQHALFIDEITNVKPCEQSLVFHLILNKSIGPNVGKLPDNAVVISAGNSKEESESAYNMPEPLFRRFGAHIYLEPNIQDWLEWGSRPQKDNPSRTNIHPLVSAFVGTYGDKVFYSKYDPENPPKYAIDPRGLEQLSNIIYANNNVIRKELISNKFGEDVATNFIAFAKNPPISATDVLLGNYTQEDLPKKFDQKYTLMLSLRNVGEDSVQGVRKFIGENLGGELLSQFDNIWVGENSERAILINEMGGSGEAGNDDEKGDPLNKHYKITLDDFWKNHKDNKSVCGVFLRTYDELKLFLDATTSLNDSENLDMKIANNYDFYRENNYGKFSVITSYENMIYVDDNVEKGVERNAENMKPIMRFNNARLDKVDIYNLSDIDITDWIDDKQKETFRKIIENPLTGEDFDNLPKEYPESELNLK